MTPDPLPGDPLPGDPLPSAWLRDATRRALDEAPLQAIPRGRVVQMLRGPGLWLHLQEFTAMPGDVPLPCSDGLHEHEDPEAIAAALCGRGDPAEVHPDLVAGRRRRQ